MIDLTGRHPATVSIARYFAYDHLPASLREVSARCEHGLMIRDLPDGPELTTGLRKLLEAKDCFVRAALDQPGEPSGPVSRDVPPRGLVSMGVPPPEGNSGSGPPEDYDG